MSEKTNVVGVTDGGNGLSDELAVQMPNFIHILDKPHLASHLNETADKAGKSKAERDAWVEAKLQECHDGKADQVINECRSHKSRGKTRATQVAGYIDRFKSSVNYGEFEKHRYPLGAGEGESFADQLLWIAPGRRCIPAGCVALPAACHQHASIARLAIGAPRQPIDHQFVGRSTYLAADEAEPSPASPSRDRG